MTENIQRDTFPFLWVVVMGLCNNNVPGDYELVQVCLLTDKDNQKITGTNMSHKDICMHLTTINVLH